MIYSRGLLLALILIGVFLENTAYSSPKILKLTRYAYLKNRCVGTYSPEIREAINEASGYPHSLSEVVKKAEANHGNFEMQFLLGNLSNSKAVLKYKNSNDDLSFDVQTPGVNTHDLMADADFEEGMGEITVIDNRHYAIFSSMIMQDGRLSGTLTLYQGNEDGNQILRRAYRGSFECQFKNRDDDSDDLPGLFAESLNEIEATLSKSNSPGLDQSKDPYFVSPHYFQVSVEERIQNARNIESQLESGKLKMTPVLMRQIFAVMTVETNEGVISEYLKLIKTYAPTLEIDFEEVHYDSRAPYFERIVALDALIKRGEALTRREKIGSYLGFVPEVIKHIQSISLQDPSPFIQLGAYQLLKEIDYLPEMNMEMSAPIAFSKASDKENENDEKLAFAKNETRPQEKSHLWDELQAIKIDGPTHHQLNVLDFFRKSFQGKTNVVFKNKSDSEPVRVMADVSVDFVQKDLGEVTVSMLISGAVLSEDGAMEESRFEMKDIPFDVSPSDVFSPIIPADGKQFEISQTEGNSLELSVSPKIIGPGYLYLNVKIKADDFESEFTVPGQFSENANFSTAQYVTSKSKLDCQPMQNLGGVAAFAMISQDQDDVNLNVLSQAIRYGYINLGILRYDPDLVKLDKVKELINQSRYLKGTKEELQELIRENQGNRILTQSVMDAFFK